MPRISGPIVDIGRSSTARSMWWSPGHTHQAYVCEIDGRLVTSGDKFGTLAPIDLKLDPRRVRHQRQGRQHHRAHRRLPKDAEQAALPRL